MLAAPQLLVVLPGPAGRDRAVDQADPAVHYLEGVSGGRHELLQDRSNQRDDGGDDPRYFRLRDSLHVTEEFLRHIMPQVMHAISTAAYRPHVFFRPTPLFQGISMVS